MNIRIFDGAKLDLLDGYYFYESQLSVYAIIDCRQNPDLMAQRLIEENNKIV